MYTWTCTCGDGHGMAASTPEGALLSADVHRARAGRLRHDHVCLVVCQA